MWGTANQLLRQLVKDIINAVDGKVNTSELANKKQMIFTNHCYTYCVGGVNIVLYNFMYWIWPHH